MNKEIYDTTVEVLYDNAMDTYSEKKKSIEMRNAEIEMCESDDELTEFIETNIDSHYVEKLKSLILKTKLALCDYYTIENKEFDKLGFSDAVKLMDIAMKQSKED